MKDNERAVVTVVGKDAVGILAKAAACLADANVNIVQVTQSVADGFFTMMMIVDIAEMNCAVDDVQNALNDRLPAMQCYVMHENIFNAMHRI